MPNRRSLGNWFTVAGLVLGGVGFLAFLLRGAPTLAPPSLVAIVLAAVILLVIGRALRWRNRRNS